MALDHAEKSFFTFGSASETYGRDSQLMEPVQCSSAVAEPVMVLYTNRVPVISNWLPLVKVSVVVYWNVRTLLDSIWATEKLSLAVFLPVLV